MNRNSARAVLSCVAWVALWEMFQAEFNSIELSLVLLALTALAGLFMALSRMRCQEFDDEG